MLTLPWRSRTEHAQAIAEARSHAAMLLRHEVNDLEAHLSDFLGMPLPAARAAAVAKAHHGLDELRAALQTLER